MKTLKVTKASDECDDTKQSSLNLIVSCTWLVMTIPSISPVEHTASTVLKRRLLVKLKNGHWSTIPVMIVSTCTIYKNTHLPQLIGHQKFYIGSSEAYGFHSSTAFPLFQSSGQVKKDSQIQTYHKGNFVAADFCMTKNREGIAFLQKNHYATG